MRLPEEPEDRGMGMPVIYTIMAVSAFVLIVLAIVLLGSRKANTNGLAGAAVTPTPSKTPETEVEFGENQQDIEALYREKKLRSEDLDFWDMYKDRTPDIEVVPETSPSPSPSHEPTDEELASDGKHTRVTFKDGTSEWQEISEELPLYEYDLTNLKITNGKMSYSVDGKEKSWLGVSLSEENDAVDFDRLKEDGIDFVMLRLGGRGYESGLLTLDENFVYNATEAVNAGLDIGVYFESQAVTVEEAKDEAEYVVSNLLPYEITYPVAYVMEYAANDDSRIDILDAEDKTKIAETFLTTVELDGYQPVLYGDKSWLLTELIPEELLKNYDIWLSDTNPVPDYPYDFKMWKYAVAQPAAGVTETADYIISFVDYARK